jgi:DNA-binding NarL/FixJ family response regulator
MITTVAIVEDNAGICQELEHLFSRAPDLRLVAVCRNAPTALRTLPACAPEVILMDIELPGQSGIECTGRLKVLLPQAQILMFTVHDEGEHIMNALAAGAIGYLLKSAPPDDILQAVRDARHGGAPMTGEVARKVIETFHRKPAADDVAQLTFREREVVQLLTKGLLDKQIADQLAISLQTVNSHLKHIYAKLGVRSRTEAVVKFLHG